uniref:Uncharacterized protein n=1 Tax=Moniliophthora roreri TaxID=221103 RepID=A0A0W0F4W3_MONRR
MSEYPDPLSSLIDRLRRRTDRNRYLHPNINNTWSLITRLTSEPRPSKNDSPPDSPPLPIQPLNPPLMTPLFILTPLPIPTSNLRSNRPMTPPPENPHLRPLPTPEVFRHLKHQFLPNVKIIPTVGGAGPSNEDKDEDRENQTPSNDEDLPTLSLRSPTLCLTPMTLLINCISALGGDTDFLFIGADPRKVQRFKDWSSVDTWMAMGWQPAADIPTTPMLQSVDEMPDTSYDYDAELYGDGES